MGRFSHLRRVYRILLEDCSISTKRLIVDNLARKAVDTKTKLLCYRELKGLYGLKRTDTLKKGDKLPDRSTELTGKMSDAEIAKEVIEDYIEALRRTRTCTCVENVPVPQSSLPQTLRRERIPWLFIKWFGTDSVTFVLAY